jgi:hypothetical protein
MCKFLAYSILSFLFFSFKPIKEKCSKNEVTSFKVLGERCSGTNFCSSLVESNLNFQNNFSDTTIYGHKHFIWWVGSEIEEKTIESFVGDSQPFNPKNFFFQNSENCLFILIVRNPYDWVRSWYLAKHHMYPEQIKSFSCFYKAPYKFKPNAGDNVHLKYLEEYHPELGRGFNNIFELRKHKHLNYLKLFDIVSNMIVINYEYVYQDPEGFLNFIAENYAVSKKQVFQPVKLYKGSGNIFKEKKYFEINRLFLNQINELIDWDIENLLGYKKRS